MRHFILIVAAMMGGWVIWACGGGRLLSDVTENTNNNNDNTVTNSDGTTDNDGDADTIEVTSGPNTQTPLAVDADICLVFSEALNASTITTSTFTVKETGVAAASNTCASIASSNAETTYCCLRDEDLKQNTSYTINVGNGAETDAGNDAEYDENFVTTCSASDDFRANTLVGDSTNSPTCWTQSPDPYDTFAMADIWSIDDALMVDAPTAWVMPSSSGGDGRLLLTKTLACDPITVTARFSSWDNFGTASPSGFQISDAFQLIFADNEEDVENAGVYKMKYGAFGTTYFHCKAGTTDPSESDLGNSGTGVSNPCNLSDGPL